MITYPKVILASILASLLVSGVLMFARPQVLQVQVAPATVDTLGAAALTGELTTVSNPWTFSNTRTGLSIASSTHTTFRVGTGGTPFTKFLMGTCTLGTLGAASIDASHAASTTKSYDCPVTGAASGDTVLAQIATSSSNTLTNGWVVVGAKASSTANYISVTISNLTGTANVPSATGVGSSTSYIISR
jgi:hypothetical protein